MDNVLQFDVHALNFAKIEPKAKEHTIRLNNADNEKTCAQRKCNIGNVYIHKRETRNNIRCQNEQKPIAGKRFEKSIRAIIGCSRINSQFG